MRGQLALVIEETTVVPAAVWEMLPPERQVQVAVSLGRLLARIVEARAMSDRGKITEQHRRRRAVVYVRQSTPTQLERNHESRAGQYVLRQRAIGLGWPSASVSVVDEDLGRSGASSDAGWG